jgi:predicted site-specific integrase-resolvase
VDDLLTTGDVCNWLGIAPPTARRLVRLGQLRVAAKTVGGIHLFRGADVLTLARQRAEDPRVIYPPILDDEPEAAP